MSTLGIDLRPSGGFGVLAPLRQRRDLVAGLDLVDGVVVGRAVGLGAADDPDIGRRRVDALRVLRQLELVDDLVAQIGPPAGRRDQEVRRPACRSCASRARRTRRSTCRASAAGSSARRYRAPRRPSAPWSDRASRSNRACRSWAARRPFISAGGNAGTLANVFIGPAELPCPASTLVSCLRVTSMVISG